MDVTCRSCGNPAEVAVTEGAEATCGLCSKEAELRRLIFDVTASDTPAARARARARARREAESEGPSSNEETRLLDLRDLARISRESLASLPPKEEIEAPLNLHDAILLVKSITPAAVEPVKIEVAEEAVIAAAAPDTDDAEIEIDAPRPVVVTSASPARRRWRAAYSGVALLIVMAGLVAAKAKIAREKAFAAVQRSEARESTAQVSSTAPPPAAEAAVAASMPSALPSAGAAPTSTPRKTPATHPVAPRPRAPAPAPAPAPVDTADPRASAGPEATPHVDLLDAMQAAVSRHSAPPSVVKGDCPPGPEGSSGAPSPCARAAPRTSPLHP
jgi:hypothetical protein